MKKNSTASILVSVPVCSFRKGFAREYLETEEVPPPSTVYGFLLSLVGEEDRNRYIGTELAYAMLKEPELSTVLRTAWRIKHKKIPLGVGKNKRPDYQEVLTGLKLIIFLKSGELSDRVQTACLSPEQNIRYGGLSLGESRDLVNDIVWCPNILQTTGRWLVLDPCGEYPLPVWVDHVGSKKTIWRQFSIREDEILAPATNDSRWIVIQDHK